MKKIKNICDTWTFYEIQISVSINEVLLISSSVCEYSHAKWQRWVLEAESGWSQKACFLCDPLQSKFAGSHSNPEHLCDIQVG